MTVGPWTCHMYMHAMLCTYITYIAWLHTTLNLPTWIWTLQKVWYLRYVRMCLLYTLYTDIWTYVCTYVRMHPNQEGCIHRLCFLCCAMYIRTDVLFRVTYVHTYIRMCCVYTVHTVNQLSFLPYLPQFVKLLVGQVDKLVKVLQTKEKLLEGSRKDLKQLQWVCAQSGGRRNRYFYSVPLEWVELGPAVISLEISFQKWLQGMFILIRILTCSTYYPPVCAYCELIFLCSSPLTCQSFSTRKIAAQCISNCKFKLSLTYIRTCICTISNIHLQLNAWPIQTYFAFSFHLLSNTMIMTLCFSSSLCVSLFLLLQHTYVLTLQTLAEEQSKRVKELSEELSSVQEELDQQKRLNETLVRRKVHGEHPRCVLCSAALCVVEVVCTYVRTCLCLLCMYIYTSYQTYCALILWCTCRSVYMHVHHTSPHASFTTTVLPPIAHVWGYTEEEGFAQLQSHMYGVLRRGSAQGKWMGHYIIYLCYWELCVLAVFVPCKYMRMYFECYQTAIVTVRCLGHCKLVVG